MSTFVAWDRPEGTELGTPLPLSGRPARRAAILREGLDLEQHLLMASASLASSARRGNSPAAPRVPGAAAPEQAALPSLARASAQPPGVQDRPRQGFPCA